MPVPPDYLSSTRYLPNPFLRQPATYWPRPRGPFVRGTGTLFAAVGTTTSYVLDMPNVVVNDDILYASITLNNNAGFTAGNEFGASDSGVPAGWTKVHNESTNTTTTFSLHVFRKVVTNAGSEPSSYTWTAAAAVTGSGNILAVGDADTTALDGSAVSEYNGDAGSTVTDNITTTVANDLLLCFAALDGGTSSVFTGTPAGFIEQWSWATLNVGQRNSAATKDLADIGTYPVSWTVNVAGTARALWVAALKPIISAVTTPTISHRMVGVSGTVKTKTSDATSVRLKIGTDTGVTVGVVYSSAQIPDGNGDATHDTSGLGLSAGGTYYYRVEMTDSGAGTTLDSETPVGRIKVAPTGQTSFAFNFSSCHDTADQADSASMDAIATRADDLFFQRGDLYYNDGSGNDAANFRTKMTDGLTRPNYKKVFATYPVAYSGSDHDSSMNNNGNAGTDATALANFNTVYRELVPTPTLPTGGHYYAFTWGRVRFINLDSRSFATIPSATDNASKSLLGTTQKQWLKDEITNAAEKLIIILGDGPWATSATVGDDTWAGYMTERAELATHFDTVGKPVIILCGDQHGVAADDGTNGLGYTSLCAAPLGQNASQKGTWSAGVYPAAGTALVDQYGRVVITDSGNSITVDFTGYSSDNTPRITLSVDIADVTGDGRLGLSAQATVKKVSTPALRGHVGVSAQTATKKVAVVSARSALGATSLATVKKVSTPTLRGHVGLSSQATAKKVSTPALRSHVGLASLLSRVPGVAVTANASIGLTGITTVKKVLTPTASSHVGLVGVVAAKKVASGGGRRVFVGLAGLATVKKVSQSTGFTSAGLTAWASLVVVDSRAITARSMLGLAGLCTGKKRATPLLLGELGVLGRNTAVAKKSTGSVARSFVGLASQVTGKKVAATGGRRVFVGLAAWAVFTPPVTYGTGMAGSSVLDSGQSGNQLVASGQSGSTLIGSGQAGRG